MKTPRYERGHNNPTTHDGATPPRFAGTMGVLRWVILGGMIAFALIMVLTYFGATPWASRAAESAQYHCPMHPTYVANQPGDCPICGMSLVPIRTEAANSPEHGHSGGTMESPPAADPIHSGGESVRYTCPMHPEVVSDTEGRCPQCGMYLVPVQHENAPMHGHASGVPGLAPITLEPRRVQMIGLKTGIVERRPIHTRTRLVGYVAADETRTSSLNVRTSGWVKSLHVNQTGQEVSRGAPLLSLYSQDLYAAQQDLLVAFASYNKTMNDSTLASTRERLLDAARDRLGLLGMSSEDITRLETTGGADPELTLRSPFSGVVMEKNVVDGQFITPEQTLFRIADLGTVWVLADVYERDIASIRVATPARMSLAAFPGETFEGKVGFIYPSVSEATRTLKVRLEFTNPSLRLRPGMYAEVELSGGGPDVITVPSEAVMVGGKTQYAFIVRDRTSFEPRLITTGRRFDGWVEVLTGLEVGEEVVTSANFLIDSESRLQAAIAGMGQQTAGQHDHGRH